MNENELKTRLQHDAELFSKVFDEELFKRIKNDFSAQPAPLPASNSHHLALFYATLICSSIFMGIGIWSLMQHHTKMDPNPMPQANVTVCQSDSRMNIMPSQVGLSQEPVSVQTPSHQTQPSVFDAPNGTLFDLTVPKPQSLEDIPMVLIPGHGLVRLNRNANPQSEVEENANETESALNFLNEATEVVRVPMGWILEE